ncbi:GTP-binding protein (dynamin domain) [Campylobacter iguaniorum]|uniref:dynamin family protein n=1 Tax=Campylobacter iguaniorum TaxID=1244531 RepID=UPI0007C899A4|nr:dynamin family protein [Campylobacter iguaniorum]ANE35568.1 GTP-binding protein (dynamin domain) [Campylobacter iguaniorum]
MSEFLNEVWGIGKLYIDFKFKRATNPQIAAIILSVNPDNYDRYISLNSFKSIFKSLELDVNEYSVQLMQVGVLNAVIALEIRLSSILEALNELAKNEIIRYQNYEFLTKFLNSLELKEAQFDASELTFHKNINTLNEIYSELISLGGLKTRLDLAYENANNSKFFIAVTGVINAGKSSTLNALMNQKILGASNIPETANLSVLTYSKEPFAKVDFWDKEAQISMNLEPKDLTSKTVAINELKNYTTAANDISKFVKEVTLGVDLEILKDGINIVDTPGLDDAVVLREELTKSYMQTSDFILHLMNASQSATKKDMSFICNTLKNGKSGGLIVVLTHVDKLSKDDLAEVLAYTKSSVQTELREYGFDESLGEDVEYFCVSATQNIGINELKNYLYDKFFGANSPKANLIIDNYKKELLNVTEIIKDSAFDELSVLNGDAKSSSLKLDSLNLEITKLNENLEEINIELANLLKKLDYSDTNEFSSLKNIASRIKDRIISDVKYAKSKKQKVDFDRLGVICESGFNDMFVDFFRDFKHRVSKDIDSAYERLKLKLNASGDFAILDIKEYLEANMPAITYTNLKENIFELIGSNLDFELLAGKLNAKFDEFIASLELSKSLNALAIACSSEFIDMIKANLKAQKEALFAKEQEIKKSSQLLENRGKELEDQKANLKEKIERLDKIYSRISAC